MPTGLLNMALLRRTRRKGLVLLAIICLTSSTILRICIQGERIYKKYGITGLEKGTERIDDGAISPDRINLRRVLNSTHALPTVINSACIDTRHCTDKLSPNETTLYKQCSISASNNGHRLLLFGQQPCRFLNSSNRQPIALASFPGSGNTWVRGLLQLATGICTGSIYCDRDLRRNGFTGEGLYSGSVLVTKTHRANCNIKKSRLTVGSDYSRTLALNFTKVVLLIRSPFSAIISERNRQNGITRTSNSTTNERQQDKGSKHIAIAGKGQFGNNQEWNRFIQTKIKSWKNIIQFWLIKYKRPALLVTYEDLKSNTFEQVKKILQFINYNDISDEELKNNLKDGFNTYHRTHKSNTMYRYSDYYTSTQIQIINEHIRLINHELLKNNKTTLLSLQSYVIQFVQNSTTTLQ